MCQPGPVYKKLTQLQAQEIYERHCIQLVLWEILLQLSCSSGYVIWRQFQRFVIINLYIFQHNADVKCVDQDGRTCLAYAKAALSIATAKSQSTNGSRDNEVTVSTCKSLVELLLSYGCPEASTVSISGTIPRRRAGPSVSQFEKTPSSVV